MILWDSSASLRGYDVLISLPVFLPNPPIGWEVFYQATLITTSIRSTELTSKRESNCNVMVMGPTNHGLHVIFLATAMSSSLYRLIVATISSPSFWLGYTSALALSRTEVICVTCEPKQFALIVGSRRLLADQRLFRHGQAWFLGRWH